MTVFFLESVSELILFGLLPLFVTVATVWILWRVLEKTDADEVIDIRSFLTFIVVVIPFVILVYGGLTVVIYNEMMGASGARTILPLAAPLSRAILGGAIVYIGLALWVWLRWHKLSIRKWGRGGSRRISPSCRRCCGGLPRQPKSGP